MHMIDAYWSRFRRRVIIALVLVGFALVGLVYQAQAAPPPQTADDGKVIFEQKCASCHTIGGGVKVGPDLKGVTALRERDWLIRWLMVPDQMLQEGDPIATQLLQEYQNIPMPNLRVSETDAAALIAYMEAQSGQATPAQPAPQAATTGVGDAAMGRALFVGNLRLANDGTACISCHTVSEIGGLGGGTLGPDLTQVAARYGDAGLISALQGLPFPTMQSVFATKPLTPDEVAGLQAYFVQTNQAAQAPMSYTFVWVGLVGAALFMALSRLIWRKQHTGVRRALVHSK